MSDSITQIPGEYIVNLHRSARRYDWSEVERMCVDELYRRQA